MKKLYCPVVVMLVCLLAGCSSTLLNKKQQDATASSEQEVQPPLAVVTPPPKPKPVVPKPKPKPPKYMGEKKLLVIGSVERVTIKPPGLKVNARIDTGAETSSLHADPIVRFERDGKRWVRFTLQESVDGKPVVLERPVVRRVRIKRHDAESQRRYVVKLWLHLGEIREEVEVTLTDRSDFEFPLLVGRNWLTDTAVVDVSRRYVVK